MKGLATLIKLHKRTLDELRRTLVGLENQKSELQLMSQALKDELVKEMQLAGNTPEIGHFFGDFAKRIQMRQERIAGEMRELDKKIEAIRIEISDAFSELKKYELAQENAKRRAAELQLQRETIQLDEIAGQQHQRKSENP